jgi:hypothetical protein
VFIRRRRPLLRAAMVGGTAYAVGRRAQRGAERETEQEARIEELESEQQAPVALAGGPTDLASKLTELKGLLDAGALTKAEFETAKRKVLAG